MKITDDLRCSDGTLPSHSVVGGYPLYYIDREGTVLCADCANKRERENQEYPEFLPNHVGINYEDAELYCDDCGCRIESAYGED